MSQNNELPVFWSISDRGSLVVEHIQLFNWLSGKGYRVKAEKDVINLYRIEKHLINNAYIQDLVNEIIDYLTNVYREVTEKTISYPKKPDETFVYEPIQVLERFTKHGFSKIFAEKNLLHIQPLQVDVQRHTKETATFYFKNKFVKVTAHGPTLHDYSELNGKCIFSEAVIDREINVVDIHNENEQNYAYNGAKFADFLARISGEPEENEHSLEEQAARLIEAQNKQIYLYQLIGFLLHDYRQQGLTDFCAIFSDDEAGGTGKGLIFQALKQLTDVCLLDAKKKREFDPISLTEHTKIKVYNDIQRSFDFSEAYNEITDGGKIIYKREHENTIDYKDTWKVAITSNYIVRGNNPSDLRRQRVFNMSLFFNENRTVQQYYGHSFFSEDWRPEDWIFFYNLMFNAVKLWLQSEYKVSYEDAEYKARKIETEYPQELREYIDSIKGGDYYPTGELYHTFKNDPKYNISPFVKKLTPHFFGNRLTKYLEETGRKFHKTANRMQIYIAPKDQQTQSRANF
jgi:hypothetical protein